MPQYLRVLADRVGGGLEFTHLTSQRGAYPTLV